MSLEEQYIQMSWILLEYELIYFNKSSIIDIIHPDWLELRTINDDIYDKKLAVFEDLAKQIGANPNRPVGLNLDRPSVKLIIEKFKSAPLSINSIPLIWPDVSTETDYEIHFRICQQVLKSGSIQVKNKSKIKKTS